MITEKTIIKKGQIYKTTEDAYWKVISELDAITQSYRCVNVENLSINHFNFKSYYFWTFVKDTPGCEKCKLKESNL